LAEKFKFEEKITTKDLLEILDPRKREIMDLKIKLMANKLQEPKLTYEQILDMEIKNFSPLLQAFNKKFDVAFLG